MADPMAHPQPLEMDPSTQGRSLAARCDATPAAWRTEPTRALLLPPHAGTTAAAVLETTPGVFASRVQCDRWLGRLAGLVRVGQVSPEQALLAACIYGETRRPEPEAALVVPVEIVRP